MAERNEPLPPDALSAPTLLDNSVPAGSVAEALASTVSALPAPTVSKAEEEARERIAALEREAKAVGSDPSAALLFHEIGLLWEEPLKNPRSAAVAYQNAYKLAPRFLSNLRAARRLFADVGNWQMVIQLLDAELAAVEDAAQKAPLLFEKASCLQQRLSREEEAAKVYQQVLEMEPSDVALLQQLEAVYQEREEDAQLAEVYLLLADALQDDVLKAHYLTLAGYTLEDRLGKKEDAATLYREAFQLDRRDPLLLAAMLRLAEREDRPEEQLQALAAEAEALGAQASPTFLRISKVYARLGRQEDALAALLAARRVAPNEALVLSELATIYESEGRHEELADVLSSWVSALTDEREAVALNLRLAALYEEELRRDDDAIARYQAVLSRVPGHSGALAGLGKLYHRTANWQGLISVFEIEVASSEDPKQKAAKLYKAAEIEERVGKQDGAIRRYNLCLQLQPGYLPAQQALTRLYEKQGRFADLVAMYEQDLVQSQHKDETIATLNKIASIYEERLSDLDHAIDSIKRILELEPDHLPSLRNLARLYERAGRWADLIGAQEAEATLVTDTKQVIALQHRNAEILEEQLKDRAGAIGTYERILGLSPSYLPALKALGRLYAQDARWDELIRMYRAEAEIAPNADHAASLIFKVGELHERRLKQVNEAIAAYQEVLTLSPTYFPAQRALARIYRASASWEALVEVLRGEASSRTDPQERANALFQAASIWEEKLEKPGTAIEGYQEVLRLSPSHPATLRALERLYTAKGDVKELIAVLDREAQMSPAPAARVAAHLKLARIYTDKVNEPARAALACEAVLNLDAGNFTALKALERLRAADKPRRAELRTRMADTISDERLRTALKVAAATELDGATPAAADALTEALAESPQDGRIAFALERALRASQDFGGLAQLYQRRLSAVTDPTERLELTLRVADLNEMRLLDFPRAKELYESALEQNPSLLPALQGRSRVALKLKDWAGARAALEQEGRACRDVQSALRAFTAAGRLCADQLSDPDGAIANFRRALERDPLDPAASAGLEQLLATRGGASDLAVLHERRGDAKLAQKDLVAAATEFYAAAKLWVAPVNDPERALAAVERTLAAHPGHVEALELKGELAITAGQYQDAATALSLRVQQGGESKALSAIHLKLGWLYQTHLEDGTRAAAHLQTAVAADGANLEALERLADIHTASRNWTGAADCRKRLLELETSPDALGRHTVALAKIFDEGFADPAQATALYRKALELTPGDGFVVDRLVDLYERTKNVPELIQVLEQQAAQSADARRTIALRLKIGDIYARALGDPQRAIATFKNVLELDPRSVDAHAALAELYMRDAAAAPMAIDEHRQLLRLDPTRLDSLHALFRLWEGLRQADKAFAAACALQFFRAANEAETVFYTEYKARIPQEVQLQLPAEDLELLMHPWTHGGIVDVLRVIGDQLTKLFPPNFEDLGIDKKADRLKPDHAVHKAIKAVAQVFGVQELEVFHARRGLMTLETTEPLSVCVGQEVVRKFNAREQKFLMGRAVHGLLNKTALLTKLTPRDRAKLLGSAVRVGDPEFSGVAQRDEAQEKQLRKALPRRALKQLELVAASVHPDVDVEHAAAGLLLSADRAGLLMSGDILMGLNMLLRQDPGYSTQMRTESADVVLFAAKQRDDVRELLSFAISEDFFKLRQKVGLAIVL